MDVITVSSDSEEEPENMNVDVSGPPAFDDEVYNVEWNDNAGYPAIDYNSQPEKSEEEDNKELENKIEEFITPIRQKKTAIEIENFSDTLDYIPEIINSTLNDCTSSQPASQSSTNFTKTLRQKLSQEEKQQAKQTKEQKKLEKEKLKEEKRLEQLKQKAYKTALVENQRNLKPEENIKFLKVHIDNEILNSDYGTGVVPILQQNNIKYVVEPQIKSFTITWSKRSVEKIVADGGELSENIINREEDQLLYVIDWQKTVKLVYSNELLSEVQTIVSNYIDKKLTLVVCGMKKYFDYKRHKRDRDMKADLCEKKKPKLKAHEREFEEASHITREQLEYALTDLQLFGKHNYRLIETAEELSSLVLNFTKSLSQIDFKLEKKKRQEDFIGFFSDSNQCVKIDKNGMGLLKLWQQQICQFSTVGLETAQAIVSQYNSPLSLVNQYKSCSDCNEGELLLQNIQIRREAGILSSSRRVGPQLSKKMYKFFTSEDPEEEL